MKHTNKMNDDDMESFLVEIEEYSRKLQMEKSGDSEENRINSTDDEEQSESLVDSFQDSKSEVEHLKDALEKEKDLVKGLEAEVLKKDEVIKTLKDQIENKESTLEIEPNPRRGEKMCRYWNRGFCREKKECKYTHCREDCENHLDKGKCVDKACPKRHRKECKYFNKGRCFRETDCEYLHIKKQKENHNKSINTDAETIWERPRKTNYRCDHCSFECERNITMKNILTQSMEICLHRTMKQSMNSYQG